MSVPLIVGKKILGALDVQSTQEAAFNEDDITILKVLADQVAIAIDNARLLSDTQAALENSRRAYGEISHSGWERLLKEKQAEVGYISHATGDVRPVSGKANSEFQKAISSGEPVLANKDATLHLPITVRGEVIGVIQMDKPKDGGRWTVDELAVANTLIEQLGTALESARLYGDISQRAERENVISTIASKISSSVRLDTILHNTVQELGKTLVNSEIILQLGVPKIKGKSRE
jgi:GAF domain-containing protein